MSIPSQPQHNQPKYQQHRSPRRVGNVTSTLSGSVIPSRHVQHVNDKSSNITKKEMYTMNRLKSRLKWDFKPKKRIIVIGDIHGDYDTLVHLLRKLKVVDATLNWTAKNTIMVQVGDQIDAGTRYTEGDAIEFNNSHSVSDVSIITFLNQLHIQAIKHKSAVLSLIGNHEIMNTTGDFTYVSKRDLRQLGGVVNRRKLFQLNGPFCRMLAYSRYGVLKIGDCIFVHGGLEESIVMHHTPEQINAILQKYLTGRLNPTEYDLFYKFYLDDKAPVWSRSQSPTSGRMSTAQKERCKKMLKHWGGRYLFLGHTPQMDGITSDCDNQVWRVDTGMSRSFGDGNSTRMQALIVDSTRRGKVFTIVT